MSPATPDDRARDAQLIRSLCEETRDLIGHLEGGSVRRVLIDTGGLRIEIEREQPASAGAPPAAPAPAGAQGEPAPGAAEGRHPVLAPLVGTFYRAPEPGAKPFVQEGDVVAAGQQVGIVEAMKLMNEIQAGREGRVVEIVVGDGERVEFEQVLLYLEPVHES